jgi:hypothetical protein
LSAKTAIESPTAFDLVSDMHIDAWKTGAAIDWVSLRTPGTRILVDAGDDADSPAHSEAFLLEARDHYDVVIVVDGNHHHHSSGMTVAEGMQRFREFARTNDIVYLDGETEYLKDGVLFIGANGWYNFCVGFPTYSAERCGAVWRDQMDLPVSSSISHPPPIRGDKRGSFMRSFSKRNSAVRLRRLW